MRQQISHFTWTLIAPVALAAPLLFVQGCSDDDNSSGANGDGGVGPGGADTGGQSTGGEGQSGGTGGSSTGGSGGESQSGGTGGQGTGGEDPSGGAGGVDQGTGGVDQGGAGGVDQGEGGAGGAPPTSPPSTPANVALDATSSIFQVLVTWTDSTNEEGYDIYLSNTDSRPDDPYDSVGADTTSYTIDEITEETDYYVWVVATNSFGPSPAGSASTHVGTSLSWAELYYEVSTGSVRAAANTPVGATRLDGYHSTTLADPGNLATWTQDGSVWAHSFDVDTTQTNYFWVVAENDDGSLLSVPQHLDPGPDMTGSLSTAVDTSDPLAPVVTLTWSDLANETGYELLQGETDNIESATSAATPAADAASHDITVTPGATHYFWLRALGSGGVGGPGLPGAPIATSVAVPAAPTHPATLEAEDGTMTGGEGLANGNGVLMTAAGNQVCWSNVNMSGNTEAILLYSNGEGGGDSVEVIFNSVTIGSILLENCGAWDGDCTTATTTFAPQQGTGELCLIGVGTGFIAAIDKLDVQ